MGPLGVVALAFALADMNGGWTMPREVEFRFDDELRLQPGESHAGKLWRSNGLRRDGGAVPLTIFVHGIIFDGLRHHWLVEDPDGPWDARPFMSDLVDRGEIAPTVVAVPSQTRDATDPEHLFEGLDFDAFVDAVDAALAPLQRVDRQRIVVVGHSGSACDLDRGAFLALRARRASPLALFSIDGCMAASTGEQLAETTGARNVVVTYQDGIWPRDFDDFRERWARVVTAHGLDDSRFLERIEVSGENAHLAIVEATMRRWLPRFLPPTPRASAAPAKALTWSLGEAGHALGLTLVAR
jgi:hypothetical protein